MHRLIVTYCELGTASVDNFRHNSMQLTTPMNGCIHQVVWPTLKLAGVARELQVAQVRRDEHVGGAGTSARALSKCIVVAAQHNAHSVSSGIISRAHLCRRAPGFFGGESMHTSPTPHRRSEVLPTSAAATAHPSNARF